MTKSQFKKSAKIKGVNVYSIKSLSNKDYKGYRIIYSRQLTETTQTVQKEKEMWGVDLSTIFNHWIGN